MNFSDVSLAVFTLGAVSTTVVWISARGLRPHARAEVAAQDNSNRAFAARSARRNDAGINESDDHGADLGADFGADLGAAGNAPSRCPITGRPCEGDRAYLCADYGCARKAGLSPHSAENP